MNSAGTQVSISDSQISSTASGAGQSSRGVNVFGTTRIQTSEITSNVSAGATGYGVIAQGASGTAVVSASVIGGQTSSVATTSSGQVHVLNSATLTPGSGATTCVNTVRVSDYVTLRTPSCG